MPYDRNAIWEQHAKNREARTCEQCQQPFTPTRDWQKYCSRACQTSANRITLKEFNAMQQALAKALEENEELRTEIARLRKVQG